MRQTSDLRPAGAGDRAWFLFLTLACLCAWLAAGRSGLAAPQEPAKGEAPAAKADDAAKADGAAAKPAAPAAEGEASKPSAAPANLTDDGSRPPARENMLQWAIRASGPIGLFLLCLSIYFTALVIRLFMEYRVSEAVPAPLVERLEAAIRDKKFQEAYDVCKDNDSFLARLVRTGIANLPNGRQEAKDSMLAMSDEIVTTLEMKISYLATIGTLGPMIGLVGTVWGMIMSFQTIATAGGEQPRPEKVAEGISTALFITLEGISLSVPAIFFFAFFRNRVAQMAMEANRVADRTISSLVAAAKTTKPAA
ncbi:Biopolymer transport protein ExbB [Aquisphaera giovannonii]|uniref:Biopolymer transport protein ExbB n=1 Tax=Aquisphaera giovannonii TaxID=406548 RepID=A0A5B9WAG1_9BACT|nr:MotA/TolQ/ExbB proton channel family protein [Aquisphaera giovannonii]QEH37437.1 Biopolymer transport protein ExbB [Aquisphaera giovannonii]